MKSSSEVSVASVLQGRAKRASISFGLHQGLAPRQYEQFGFAKIIKHLKTPRHIGLEGEEVQQPFAKAVDRMNLQAARRLDGAREKTTRENQCGGIDLRRADLGERLGEPYIVESRQVESALKTRSAILAAARLGKGETQNFRRRHAIEQKPQHALRQHMRLA